MVTMFRFRNRSLVVLLTGTILLLFCEDGLLTRSTTTVRANGNTIIDGPFLEIEKPSIRTLLIKNLYLPHYLPCIATIEGSYYRQNVTEYYYTWFRNDAVVESYPARTEFYIYANGTLRLPPNEKATGVYRCKVNANRTAILSESTTVNYPVLKRKPSGVNINAFSGRPLTFDCPVLSVPPANITWFYGNTSLSKVFRESRYFILANGSLIFSNISRNDSGKYRCLAQNQFAAKTHRRFVWSLTVQALSTAASPVATALIPPLQNATQYVAYGSDLKMQCRGLDQSVPVEWWFHRAPNDAPVQLANNSNVHYIRNASVEEHQGYYICATATDNQSFRVIVTVPPTIFDSLRSYEILISASMTFRCNAAANPPPVISWYYNGAPLNSSYTRFINGNELTIHSFDPDEDGIYQCFARNVAGEQSSAGEIRFRSKGRETARENPLQSIRCFAHSFNTINVTFESRAAEALFIVHIVQNNPHRWVSPFGPMRLNHSSYVVIASHIPVYRPFELITRVLFPTSEIRLGNKPQQQTMLSSLRSPPVTCCTQGLLLHLVYLGNDTFVTWSQPDLVTKKYFVVQFSVNYTHPHPGQLVSHALRGTTTHVSLTQEDVAKKLGRIETLNSSAARDVLKRAESKHFDNDARASQLETEEDVFSVVLPANVTGVLMQNFTRIKIRVLIITTENENLAQDFRYVQWKTIENDTTEHVDTPFRLTIVESRMLVFHFHDNFNEPCISVCHWQIQFPIINKDEPKCENRNITHSQLEIRGLKPTSRYRLNFSNCEKQVIYGQLDVQTLPDPPGTVGNQRVTRQNGLKLSWDPPLQPNGKIHHYNILWTLGNVTHEANVMECSVCSYKFPNISESAKINVTIRVVGETGVGAPIFIDLRTINHMTLGPDHDASNSEVYSGIVIGSLLSTFCVFCFALLIVFQRRRLKTRQQGPTHLTSPSDMNFGNLSNTNIPGDSAGGLSGSTLQHDCHEMQTLIPKTAHRHMEFLAERCPTAEYQTTQLPHRNGSIMHHHPVDVTDPDNSTSSFDCGAGGHNLSQLPLYSSTPERKQRDFAPLDALPFYTPFLQTPPNAVATQPKQALNTAPNVHVPPIVSGLPSTLPLGAGQSCANGNGSSNGRRSGSLSSSSGTSSSSGSSTRKQFHTNFPKHSNSNEGICLLAEEESAATLTPTSDTEVSTTGPLPNGCRSKEQKVAVAEKTDAATAMIMNHPMRSRANSAGYCNNSSAKKLHDRNASKSQKDVLARTQHSTSSKVPPSCPATGANAATTTSTAMAAKYWPPSVSTPLTADRGTASASATATASKMNAYRRTNVDPNG